MDDRGRRILRGHEHSQGFSFKKAFSILLLRYYIVNSYSYGMYGIYCGGLVFSRVSIIAVGRQGTAGTSTGRIGRTISGFLYDTTSNIQYIP